MPRFLLNNSVDASRAYSQAAKVLRQGGLVAFPTETVYGLGARADDPRAVQRIFAAKGRPPHNPLIVHVGSVDEARRAVANWPPAARRLAETFWPGPLTLVLPKADWVPAEVTGGGDTVGVRLPLAPVALALLRAAQLPIAAPSANRANGLSPTTADHVEQALGNSVDVLLDGGPCQLGIESTVVDLSAAVPRVLRPGSITREALSGVLNSEVLGPETGGPPDGAALRSPGQMRRHYAPRATLELAPDSGQAQVRRYLEQGLRVGWLGSGHAPCAAPGAVLRCLPEDPAGYAAGLYAALHDLDAQQVERIVVAAIPQSPTWLAIHDRLRRAAAAPREDAGADRESE